MRRGIRSPRRLRPEAPRSAGGARRGCEPLPQESAETGMFSPVSDETGRRVRSGDPYSAAEQSQLPDPFGGLHARPTSSPRRRPGRRMLSRKAAIERSDSCGSRRPSTRRSASGGAPLARQERPRSAPRTSRGIRALSSRTRSRGSRRRRTRRRRGTSRAPGSCRASARRARPSPPGGRSGGSTCRRWSGRAPRAQAGRSPSASRRRRGPAGRGAPPAASTPRPVAGRADERDATEETDLSHGDEDGAPRERSGAPR